MTDHNERACRYCGSLLHHEDVCSAHATSIALHDRLDALGAPHAGCAFERIDMLASTSTRAAYLAMAEECERLEAEEHLACASAREPAASYHHGCGTQAGRLAAWARGRAGA